MLPCLLALLTLVVPAARVEADVEAERARLREALELLAGQPMSRALEQAYLELHGRAWRVGDEETGHAAVRRIVAWWESEHGHDPARLAAGFAWLGSGLHDVGDYDSARTLYERALALREETLGPEHPDVGDSANDLGALHGDLEDAAGARPYYERALRIWEAALGPDHPDVGLVLNNLALVARALGEADEALRLGERSLEIRERALGPDHVDVAQSLLTVAATLEDLGRFDDAVPLAARALRIREAAFGPDHPLVAGCLKTQALLAEELGDFAAARPLHERALAIREAALGPGHPDVADSLDDLADFYRKLGDLAGARPLYERALAILVDVFGEEHLRVAYCLNDLALLLEALGDRGAAMPLYERALRVVKAVLGPDHPDVATVLNNLGTTRYDLGELDRARSLHERALAIREASLGPEHALVAQSVANLGIVLLALGELDEAKALHERALRVREARLGPDHPHVADSLTNLAATLRALGEAAAARPLLQRSLAIREAVYGPEHRLVLHGLFQLATLHLDAGRADEAFALARRIVRGRDRVRQTLASLTEGEGYLYLAEQRGDRDLLLATAAAGGDVTFAHEVVLHAKGRAARLALQTREQIRASLDPETLRRMEELAAVQSRLAREALRRDVVDGEAHVAELTSLREERDALERTLRRDAELAEETAVTVADVRAALPRASALVDLLVHLVYIPPVREDGRVVERSRDELRASAWVLRAEDERGAAPPVHVDLGPVATLEPAVRAHLRRVAGTGGDRGVVLAGPFASASAGGASLESLLWEPLAAHLDGVTTVFVSPDGVLGTVPFETLVDDEGRFLVEDRAFVYVSGGAALVEFSQGSAASLGDTLLAVGGVDYEHRAARGAARPLATVRTRDARGAREARDGPSRGLADAWAPLPATAAESEAIVATHAATGGGATGRLLLGADATEERLKAEMPRHGILHLATHGFFLPGGVSSSWDTARAAGRDGAASPASGATGLVALHPGLLSGLVLAGANRPLKDDAAASDAPFREDGYLTASEVTLLDLSRVDLVVLSACETGLGRPESGEGLLGLRRAFHMAGAATVVSSQWSVADESTSELMQSFYANLFFDGMGRHAALRAAQLEMLQRNRREYGDALPSTWGAFVLSGEWR